MGAAAGRGAMLPARGDGCWPGRDAQAPREGVSSARAAARKPPDFPEMSISGETWKTAAPLGRGGSQGGMFTVAVGRTGGAFPAEVGGAA